MARVGQANLELACFQDVIECHPVHARGLHDYHLDPAYREPFRHPLQIRSPTAELPNRLRIAARRHRHIMALITNVNSSHVPVYDLQPWVFSRQLSCQFPALLAIEAATAQALKGRLLPVCHVTLSLPLS